MADTEEQSIAAKIDILTRKLDSLERKIDSISKILMEIRRSGTREKIPEEKTIDLHEEEPEENMDTRYL